MTVIMLSKLTRESKNQRIFESALKELSSDCKLVDVALGVWKWQKCKDDIDIKRYLQKTSIRMAPRNYPN